MTHTPPLFGTMSGSSGPPPVSLGKPSLRHRLESYYSLVAPDAIADKDEWTRKFEIIYNKYGGCHDKETKLANKLANKYGNQVRLLVAPPHRSQRQKVPSANHQSAEMVYKLHDEQHYTLEENRINSKILDFTSTQFDPFHALSAPERIVTEANPSIFSSLSSSASQKLDNISKFRALLPACDPQRIEPKSKKRKTTSSTTDKNNKEQTDDKQKKQQQQQQKRVPMFLAMVSKYEHKSSGPLSLLYSILQNRQRVRVMIRYVDCIRGTLTGYLVAFDKHFNMILKDVDEVYGSRVTQDVGAVEVAAGGGSGQQNNGEASAPSKSTLEAQRRRCYPKDGSGGPGPAVKQRYFNQLMIRGDNVVMVWRAEAERSMHPQTKKSPVCSVSSISNSNTSESRIGTPGSLYFALQRWESQQKKRRS